MFKSLSDLLSNSLRNIRGKGYLTENNIKKTLEDVKISLLKADVALPVIKKFIDRITETALGQKINKSFTPGQKFIQIVYEELVFLLKDENSALNLKTVPPAVILLIGPNGSGKTSSIGKLGNYLKSKKKKIIVVSTDIYRSGANKQLEILAKSANIDFFNPIKEVRQLHDIAKVALLYAKKNFYDILLIDTPGCLHTDKKKISEIINVCKETNPIETLLTVDATIGQDSTNVSNFFSEYFSLTGLILTKTDSNVPGGSALSVKFFTKKPIKFISTGEKIHELKKFCADSLAKRILGMNDVLSSIEDLKKNINEHKPSSLTKKFEKNNSFNLNDLLEQFQYISNITDKNKIIHKIPGMNSKLLNNIILEENLEEFSNIKAIINSMTPQERIHPTIIQGTRKRRIALGSGKTVQEVNKLLKKFNDIQYMIKRYKKHGITKIIRNLPL